MPLTDWSDDGAIGTVTWNDMSLAEVEDDDPAAPDDIAGAAVTHYLKGLNAGFTETLPPRRVIATMRRKGMTTDANRVIDHTVKLVVGGSVTGTNKASATLWDTDYETVTYTWDIPTDLSLTAAQVNAADFGIVLAVQGTGQSGSALARVDFIGLDVEPALRHLTQTDWLGRPKLGQKLSLTLQTKSAADIPIQPDSAPYADIYAGTTLVETIRLPILERYKVSWLFGVDLFLGAKYSTGQHMIVYRYLLSTVKYQAFAYFEIVGGGAVGGPIIAMTEYRKPEAGYLIHQNEAGDLQYSRNPEVG